MHQDRTHSAGRKPPAVRKVRSRKQTLECIARIVGLAPQIFVARMVSCMDGRLTGSCVKASHLRLLPHAVALRSGCLNQAQDARSVRHAAGPMVALDAGNIVSCRIVFPVRHCLGRHDEPTVVKQDLIVRPVCTDWILALHNLRRHSTGFQCPVRANCETTVPSSCQRQEGVRLRPTMRSIGSHRRTGSGSPS
jgi:hypothetical protein